MIPVIKLIHDDERDQWICGDEDGNIVIVSDVMFDGVSIAGESMQLRKFEVFDEDAIDVNIPIVPASAKAVYTGDMTLEEMLARHLPDFGMVIIELHTRIVGDYRFRAGFDKETMAWVFYDGFERVPEQVT